MRLPDQVIDRLQPYFPTLDLSTIRVELREPTRLTPGCCGHHAGPMAMVKAGSSPYPGLIVINPAFWAPDDIDGLRLIAHELYHQWQEQDPNFDAIYDAWAEEMVRQGRPSWENPLEQAAYLFERMVN